MKTFTGNFETRSQADDAVRALKDAGIAPEDIHVENNSGDGTTVIATVDESQIDPAAAILNQSGSVEVTEEVGAAEKTADWELGDPSDPRSYRREDEPDAPLIVPPLPR